MTWKEWLSKHVKVVAFIGALLAVSMLIVFQIDSMLSSMSKKPIEVTVTLMDQEFKVIGQPKFILVVGENRIRVLRDIGLAVQVETKYPDPKGSRLE